MAWGLSFTLDRSLFALNGKVTLALRRRHLPAKAFGYTGKLPQSNLINWDEGVGVWGFLWRCISDASVFEGCMWLGLFFVPGPLCCVLML